MNTYTDDIINEEEFKITSSSSLLVECKIFWRTKRDRSNKSGEKRRELVVAFTHSPSRKTESHRPRA
jgi:hypothetical protein